MELKEFENNVKTNIDKGYIEQYLNMIANSDMKLYSNRNSFKGWFMRDQKLVEDYAPSLEEVKDRLDRQIGTRRVNEFNKSTPIRLNINEEILNDDSKYVHKIIIKVPPKNILSVATNIAATLYMRNLTGAFIEIPSVKNIGLGYNESIVVRCTTEELENTIKAVSSLQILYRTSVKPLLPIYPNTGTWFGYDDINPDTKESASVDFARGLKDAIDEKVLNIKETNENLANSENEVSFMKSVIKDYILNNPTYIEEITESVKKKAKEKGLSEINPLLYENVLAELDKKDVYLEEEQQDENVIVNELAVENSVDVEQPPIDFGDSVSTDTVSANDMANEMSSVFNEQVNMAAEDAIQGMEVEVEEPQIEIPKESITPDIFDPNFVVQNEEIKAEDLQNDALDNLQNNIMNFENDINNVSVETNDEKNELETNPQVEESSTDIPEIPLEVTPEAATQPLMEETEEKNIPELHPMSETSEQINLDVQQKEKTIVNEVVEENVANGEVIPQVENIESPVPEVALENNIPTVEPIQPVENITVEPTIPEVVEENVTSIPETDANIIANELEKASVESNIVDQNLSQTPEVNMTVPEQEIVNQPETPAATLEQPVENNVEQVQVSDETLSPAEVNSLANDGLTKDYTKYAELVTDTHILDQTIPALGITVYDYFENENINSKIAPNDEVVTQDGHPLPAKEFITNKILGHVLEVPNLASDQLFMDAYNRRTSYEYLFNIYAQEQRKQQTLDEVVNKNEKKKGLFGGLFHK